MSALAVIGSLWMWLWSIQVTLMYWGWVGVVIGVLLAGVGAIGTALLALVLHGNWSGIGALALNMFVIWVLYAIAASSFALAETIKDKLEV